MNRVGIKAEARSFISENRRWLTMFVTYLPLWVAANGVQYVFSGIKFANFNGNFEDALENSSSFSFSNTWDIVSFLVIPFSVAMAGYFLEFLRRKDLDFAFPYKEGAERYGKYFVVDLMVGIITFLWSLLFIIPGIVKAYEFSQTNFIIHDNPNLSHKQVRDIGRRMINGYKSELFVLDLSFIPWYIFGAITCGIGFAYVIPYVNTVKAMYYENLKAFAIQNGTVAPWELGIVPTPEAPQQPLTYEYDENRVDYYEPNCDTEDVKEDSHNDEN